MKYLILALTLISPLYAQTAKVIALSSEDAKEAELLYKQRDMINQRIQELHKRVEDHYLMEEKPGSGLFSPMPITMCATREGFMQACPETPAEKKARDEKEKKATHLERRSGWFDFEFSEDFKFIVPVQNTATKPFNWGCNVITPTVNPVLYMDEIGLLYSLCRKNGGTEKQCIAETKWHSQLKNF